MAKAKVGHDFSNQHPQPHVEQTSEPVVTTEEQQAKKLAKNSMYGKVATGHRLDPVVDGDTVKGERKP